jgi:zinc transport system substrate-binding protein
MRVTLQRLLVGLLLLASVDGTFAQPQVTTSIKPLQLIAKAITDGVSEPAVVMDATQDPHHPSLRPSQRQAMDAAEVFLWIGPQLETGLDNVTADLRGRVLSVLNAPGMTRHMIGNSIDPHVWLDTRNAISIAALLVANLEQLDPQNADRYQTNLEIFRTDMARLESEIGKLVNADVLPPFAVYHNGYQYFEKQYGLSHIASFTNNEEVQPGIRRVLAIKKQLEDNGVNCILVGPSQNTAFLDNQLDLDGMRYVTIDVLAHGFAPARDGYARFMRELAGAIANCRE